MFKTRSLSRITSLVFLASASGCGGAAQEGALNRASTPAPVSPSETRATSPSPTLSVLLAPWTGPYGGVPPLARVKVADFEPAFDAAIAEQRKEIAAIADNPAPPTFDNTLGALEAAGRTLERLDTLFGIWTGTMSSPEVQSVERNMAPKLAAVEDEVEQNAKLFARIEVVYAAKGALTPEQARLTWKQQTRFARAGAKLDASAKKRLSDINQRLAMLFTSFRQNVLSDEEGAVVLDNEADLAGLPDSLKASFATEGETRKLKGKWVVSNTRSSADPFLTYSTRADLREKVWKNFVNRGDNGGAHDNNALIAEILALRAERAKLIGYPTHAHWRLEDKMAKTPERALALMESVWTPALAQVKEETRDMAAIANKEGLKRPLAPWDYRHYAEKVRKARYDLDQNEVKPYLQLEKLREGMFWVAGELFDFVFSPVTDVEVNHPDMRVWEVKNKSTGKHVGLWYFDPYARAGKRSGAWMNAYRNQERFQTPVTTIVSNNSNFVKGAPGEAVLVSWDDARTLFHEFGHALHGLSSNVTYPTLAGTNVARDYVEFPSQLLEQWITTPEVLSRFAVHVKTGQPIPAALVAKVEKAKNFNQGFATVEYLSSALVDMKIHLAGDKKIDPDAFEKETLAALGMPNLIVMRHRTPQFGHIFGSDGYSAGYYSYLWSETLSADAYEAFREKKGPYDADVAKRLRDHVFSVGNTVDPAEAYRAFRGKEPGVDALMRARGFGKAAAKAAPPTKPTKR